MSKQPYEFEPESRYKVETSRDESGKIIVEVESKASEEEGHKTIQ